MRKKNTCQQFGNNDSCLRILVSWQLKDRSHWVFLFLSRPIWDIRGNSSAVYGFFGKPGEGSCGVHVTGWLCGGLLVSLLKKYHLTQATSASVFSEFLTRKPLSLSSFELSALKFIVVFFKLFWLPDLSHILKTCLS